MVLAEQDLPPAQAHLTPTLGPGPRGQQGITSKPQAGRSRGTPSRGGLLSREQGTLGLPVSPPSFQPLCPCSWAVRVPQGDTSPSPRRRPVLVLEQRGRALSLGHWGPGPIQEGHRLWVTLGLAFPHPPGLVLHLIGVQTQPRL